VSASTIYFSLLALVVMLDYRAHAIYPRNF